MFYTTKKEKCSDRIKSAMIQSQTIFVKSVSLVQEVIYMKKAKF